MDEPQWITVTKAELVEFRAWYPNKLSFDAAGMFEPPMCTLNDFTLGKWPDSVVARWADTECYPKPGTPPYAWEPNVYKVRPDLHAQWVAATASPRTASTEE